MAYIYGREREREKALNKMKWYAFNPANVSMRPLATSIKDITYFWQRYTMTGLYTYNVDNPRKHA